MAHPLYLSLPALQLPSTRRTNDDIVALVRENFKGDDAQWRRVERTMRFVFNTCGTVVRHVQVDERYAAGMHASNVARSLLEEQGVAVNALDSVTYSSIVREYFEPSVATEIAWRLGVVQAACYDVVSACAGPLVAIESLRGRAAIEPSWTQGLVSTASLSEGFIGFDIQSIADLDQLAAGLTIGNGATAMLVGRTPYARGGRIVGSYSEGYPQHHPLCRAPVFGVFRSAGSALFALAELVPDHVRRACARFGWTVDEVDVFVSHQPSDRILREVALALGVPASRVPQLHSIYANTEASAVPIALRHLVDDGTIKPGMKLLLNSAAAGFTLASVGVVWEG
ncbi:MAG: hypothetical protein FJ090_00870 [Deltaproteobacteria bacterium]|nr:hypothetical protein [Deltaproteobacteria bacterium]